MSFMKRKISLLIAIALVLSCLSAMSAFAADDTEVYDGNTMAPFAGRTKEEIASRYCDARYASGDYKDGSRESYYSRMPSFSSPYDQGALKKGTTDVMNAMTNYFRWLVGVQPMTKLTENHDDLQKGALVRNWQFAHALSPSSKPADMDQALWDAGASVSHNILAMGYTPSGAIAGWLDEGYSRSTSQWDTTGHRTAILNASNSGISYGYSGSVAIGVIAGRDNTWGTNAFAAYPAPGNMPCNDIRPKTSAWSLELNPAVLSCADASKVAVAVTNLHTNQSYVCTKANGMGSFSKSFLAFVQPEAAGSLYADGDSFRVEITGLNDVKSGKAAKIVYTVNFFDVKSYGKSYAVTYSVSSGWSLLHLTQSTATEENLAKINSILPNDIVVTTELGSSVHVPVSGAWVLDKESQCWTNSVNEKDLPENVTDPYGVLSSVRIRYQIDSYTGSFTLGVGSTKAGDSSTISMWRYMISTDTAQLFRVKGNKDDGYTAELIADNHSDSFAQTDSGNWTWQRTWQMEDSGTWIGLYCGGFAKDAYIAGISELDVACAHTDTYKETHAATCTEAGYERTICNICGKEVGSKVLQALGHDFAGGICTRCGAEGDPCEGYTDINRKQWYHTAADFVIRSGLMGSTKTDTLTFEPETKVSRAMVASILYRMAANGETISYCGTFSDVAAGKWYTPAIEWCAKYGLASGKGDGTFDPNGNVTRQELAVFMMKMAEYLGKDTSGRNDLNAFSDAAKVPSWAKTYVQWAVDAGLISGKVVNGKTCLSPKDNATRAEIASIIMRFVQNITEAE